MSLLSLTMYTCAVCADVGTSFSAARPGAVPGLPQKVWLIHILSFI